MDTDYLSILTQSLDGLGLFLLSMIVTTGLKSLAGVAFYSLLMRFTRTSTSEALVTAAKQFDAAEINLAEGGTYFNAIPWSRQICIHDDRIVEYLNKDMEASSQGS